MLKCVRVDRLPDDLQVTHIKYHTLAELRMKMFFEFKDYCDGLEEGQIYMAAEVPDDCSDDVSFVDLVSTGIDVITFSYEPKPTILAVGDGSIRQWRNKI